MPSSVSFLMTYSRRRGQSHDRVGGLPRHLPHQWPVCQRCQQRMGFVGQLYTSEWFQLGDLLGLQFYVCDECRETVRDANPDVTIHLEELFRDAKLNGKNVGVRCRRQPRLFITYTPVEDSTDQWTFHRRDLNVEEMPDRHLFRDKIGGLFPYDGSEGPRITKSNVMIAQFAWKGIGGPIYLYRSSKRGVYLYHYR